MRAFKYNFSTNYCAGRRSTLVCSTTFIVSLLLQKIVLFTKSQVVVENHVRNDDDSSVWRWWSTSNSKHERYNNSLPTEWQATITTAYIFLVLKFTITDHIWSKQQHSDFLSDIIVCLCSLWQKQVNDDRTIRVKQSGVYHALLLDGFTLSCYYDHNISTYIFNAWSIELLLR